jgi:PAS domain S-box-containing protein
MKHQAVISAVFIAAVPVMAASPRVLQVGAGHVPPMSYRDPKGVLRGFAVDVLNEAARREGIQLNWKVAGNSRDIEDALSRGALDLVPAGMITAERSRRFAVTDPWWFLELTVLTGSGSGIRTGADLGGRRLALATPLYGPLARKDFPKTEFQLFNDPTSATTALCQGAVDAALITHGYLDDIALARPAGCESTQLWAFDTSTAIELAIIARPPLADIARRLRLRVDDMAIDGTLARLAVRHPPIASSGAVSLAEAVRRPYYLRMWIGAGIFAWSLLVLGIMFLLKQRAAQQRLRHERELLRGVIDHVPVMIAIKEPESDQYSANREFERLLGTADASAMLAPVCGDDDAVEGALWIDCALPGRDGHPIPTSWAGVRLSDGTRVRIGLDLRERLRAEQAVRESEERLRLAAEATGLGTFDFDPRTGKIVLSGAAMRQFGLAANANGGEITYDELLSGIHPEDREGMERAVATALQPGRGHYAAEYRMTGIDDGAERWISSWGRVFYDDNNAAVRLIGIRFDVTERKRTELAIRRQAELINLSHDAIITADVDRIVTGWNSGAREMYGWTEEQAVGKRTHELLKTDADGSIEFIDEMLLRSGRWEGELAHTRADGRKLIVDSRHVLVRGPSGQPAAILEINRDVTERTRAEQEIRHLNAELEQRVIARTAQLQAANSELEAFVYSASHDLRAPLRGIEGWSRALLEDYSDRLDDRGREYLERLCSESDRMRQLIEDLLKLSRVTRAEMQCEVVDLSSLAGEIAERLREAWPQRDIEFVIKPGLLASGDPHLLEIALTNLLDNAVKFTAPRPLARIEFGNIAENGDAAFYVRDNGVGFEMTYASKLFGPFQRLHKSSEYPGVGIGLATVQRVVRRHGGRVWAHGLTGYGATFYFVLGSGA